MSEECIQAGVDVGRFVITSRSSKAKERCATRKEAESQLGSPAYFEVDPPSLLHHPPIFRQVNMATAEFLD